MSSEKVIPLDLGCQPSPSGSGELILSEDNFVYAIFVAIDTKLSKRGYLEDKGIAVLKFSDCSKMQHGYPNDEGGPEHALWNKGLSEISVGEVLKSAWAVSIEEQMDKSAKRIWGEDYCRAYNIVPGQKSDIELRHFIVCFKETTFECLAMNVELSLYQQSYAKVVRKVLDQITGV